MNTVLMHGPGISDPTKIVERKVPVADVQAYKAVGYIEGGLPDEYHTDGTKKRVYTDADAKAQLEDAPKITRNKKVK